MGFPYFDMEFRVLDFLILKLNFPHNFRVISLISEVLKWVFLHLKWKKAKKDLERNSKNKNALEFDIEKESGIIF